MTPSSKLRQCVIRCDSMKFDVVAHYASQGWQQLPPVLTMSGLDIRKHGFPGRDEAYRLVQDLGNTGQSFRPISDGEAVSLIDGMQFSVIPLATMVKSYE